MKTIWKRSLSMFLAFVMVFGMIPVNAFAVEEEFVEEILEEEIIDEEIIEEEFVEELVEEEIFEEIVEEEPVEEIFEEEIVEEAPVEETPAADPQPVVETESFHVSDEVAAEAAEVKPGTYPIWLNDNKLISELVGIVADGESIRKNVLKAVVGENYTDDDKVYFSVAAEDLPEDLQEQLGKVSDELFATAFGDDIIRVDENNYDINVAGEYFEAVQALVADALMDNHEADLGYVVNFKVNGVVITIEFKGKLWKNITVEGTDNGAITVTAAEVPDESKWLAKVAESLTVTADDPVSGKTVTLDAADYQIVVDEMGYEEPYLAPSFDPEKDSVEEMKTNGHLMLLVKVTDTEKFDLSYMEKDENGDYVLNEQGFPVINTEDFVFEVDAKLVDSRAVCYDLYINADGEDLVDGYYLEGTEAPAAPAKEDIPYAYVKNAQRDKQYYNLTWEKGVEDNNTTYGAVWTAILDDNATEVADQEETFDITFITGALGMDKVWNAIPWGTSYTDYQGESLIPDLSEIGVDKNFVRWDPFEPKNETVKAPSNSDEWDRYGKFAIRFTAVWTDNFTVKFQKADGTVDDALTQLIEDGNFAENPATEADPWVWDGYYVQSWVYAEPAGEHAAGDAFDFDTHAIETNIVLKPVGFVDRNENGKKDGTDADPFYNFKWVVGRETVCETDWLPENEGDKPTVEYYKDEVVVEKKIFNGWDTDETDPYNIIYTAKFLEDKNENGVDDALEAYKFTKNDVAGEVYLLNGETKITAQAGIYDSTKALTVVATPVVEDGNSVTYVESIKGAETPEYDDDFVATAVVTKPDDDDKSVTVTVNFKQVGIVSDGDTAVLDVHTDPINDPYTDQEVYEAAIDEEKTPYNSNMVVEYMARAKGTVTVNVGPLLTRIAEINESVANEAKELFQKYYDEATGAYNYPLPCEEAWASLNETVDTTAQQVTEAYFDELMNREDRNSYLAGLYADGTLESTLKDEMTRRINESDAGYHAFGEGIEEREGETGPMYIENLRVTYTDNKKFSVSTDNIELQIADFRPKTWIDVSAVQTKFTYGDEIVPGVGAVVKALVNGEETVVGTLDDMTVSLTGTAAGEQYVTLVYETNEFYKGSEKTYVVNVAKANTTIELDPKVVAMKGDESFNTYKDRATPKSPDGAELIHVIAGMDLESANIKIENGSFTLPDFKAWISMPQSVYDLVDAANKATDENGNLILGKPINLEDGDFYLSDLEEILETAKVDGAQEILDAMKEVTSMLGNKQGETEDMSIYVDFVKEGEQMFPEEIGAYVNAALVYDSNYNSTMAKGVLVIAPAVALPNSGIDLVCGELNKHVYEFTLDEATALTVKQAPECPVQYYGFTYSGELYLSDEAPKTAGLYVASAIYENGTESGSDSAIILIASADGSVELSSKTVLENGQAQAPAVSANGAYTLISAEASASTNVKAKVSVPEGAKKLLAKLGVTIEEGTTADLDTFIGKLDGVMVKFDEVVNEIKPVLEKIGVTDGIDDTIKKAENQIQAYVDALKAELEKLKELGNVTIVFTSYDRNSYEQPGVYFYAAVVTDPDYLPAVDAGYLVIEDKDFAVEDATVTYEAGKQQDLLPTNDAGRGYVTLIANEDKSELNLILDGDEEGRVLAKLESMLGKKLDGNSITVAQLKEKATAEKIADTIVEAINEKAAGKLQALLNKVLKDEKKAEDLYNSVMAKLQAKLEPMAQQLMDEIEALVKVGDDATLFINGTKPIEPGKYQFHYLSYAVAYDSATLEIKEKTDFVFSQTPQLWLIEPWALRANLYISHANEDGSYGADWTKEEIDARVEDYGVYFIRESVLKEALNKDNETPITDITQDMLTEADIIENGATHYTKESKKVWYNSKNGALSCDYDNGIYTYELSDSVFVLYYAVIDGETHYAPIRERNISKIANDAKDDADEYENAYERDVYAKLVKLEADTVAYRGQQKFEGIEALPIMSAPTLENYTLGTPANHSIGFSHNRRVVLIEPWGLNFIGYLDANKEYDDYGIVAYYDTEGKYDHQPTIEELLAEKNAYVFSVNNGDAEHTVENGEHRISAVYNSGVYTYQMKKSAYVVVYVKDGENYCYGPVKTRSIEEAITATLASNPSELQSNVLNSMTALYDSVQAYREDYFKKN